MNSKNFELAQAAYESGDYVEALKKYYACLKEDAASFEAGDAGLTYYRLGNCLLKMRNFQEAGSTYLKALEDEAYIDKAAARVNLGKSQIGSGDYEGAVTSFNAALADPTYQKSYQAQMGLGTAFTRLGMILDAGTAYRNAALDERNPNPTKALMQLGGCFDALGRPQDAVEVYKAIFDFEPTGTMRSKAYENLGQAYTATENYQQAIEAFTAAVAEGRYALSEEALQDYQTAQAALASAALSSGEGLQQTASFNSAADSLISVEEPEDYGAGNVPLAHNTEFFTVSDDDLIAISKKQMKKERKLRNAGLKILLIVIILLVLLLGAGVFAYWQGYGFPSQQAVITDMFTAHSKGQDTSDYWISAADNAEAIDKKMNMVASTDKIEVTYLSAHMSESEAIVTATLPEGGTLHYDIKLERSFVGWKVSDISLVFASQLQS